jgi:hypothetical protein
MPDKVIYAFKSPVFFGINIKLSECFLVNGRQSAHGPSELLLLMSVAAG